MDPETITHTDPYDQELSETLQEALACTTCILTDLSKIAYQNHRATGTYDPHKDPPFTTHHSPANRSLVEHEQDDMVAPRTIPSSPTVRNHGYREIMTPEQREDYLALIEEYRYIGRDGDAGLAQYRVDYHIHVHWLARRGILSLCRNVEEMHAYRQWKWRMNSVGMQGRLSPQVEIRVKAKGNGRDKDTRRGSDVRRVPHNYATRRMRRWGWPDDSQFFMAFQTALWRHGWEERERRLQQAKAKWALIKALRSRQRRVKWRLSWQRTVLRDVDQDTEATCGKDTVEELGDM